MRKLLILIAMLLLTALLAGCSAKSYMIKTNEGQEYFVDGPPQYDVESATYSFTDRKGEDVVINKDDIRLIKER